MTIYMEMLENEPNGNEKADEEVRRQGPQSQEDEEGRDGVSRDGCGKPWREVLEERLGHSPLMEVLDE